MKAKGAETATVLDTFIQSIVIAAPVEKVFAYMTDPRHYQDWVTVKITRLAGEGLGSSYQWVSEIEGMEFHSQTAIVEYAPNQKLLYYFTGDAAGYMPIFFQPVPGGTKVTWVITLAAKVPSSAEPARDEIVKAVRETHEQSLQKIKAAVEKS